MELWLLFAFLSAVFAGATAVLSKIGIRGIDSDLATAIRTVVVLVMAWIAAFAAGSAGDVAGISGRTMLFLVLSGLATGASWIFYFRALQTGDVSKIAPIDKSSTVLTVILAFVILGESVSIVSGIGVVLIFIGTMMMIEKKDAEPSAGRGRAWMAYAVLSAVFAALTSILGKIGIEGVESNLGTAVRTGVVLAMAWAIVLARGKQGGIRSVERRGWTFLTLSGMATGASWMCFYYALQNGPASAVVPIDKLSILFTVLFAVLVLKEGMSRRSWAGLAMLVAGTLMMAVTA